MLAIFFQLFLYIVLLRIFLTGGCVHTLLTLYVYATAWPNLELLQGSTTVKRKNNAIHTASRVHPLESITWLAVCRALG